MHKMADTKKSVLFICLGNICRSPMAEAIFRKTVKDNNVEDQWTIDSGATSAYHIGQGPDNRTMKTLKKHGINDYHHKGRQIKVPDFHQFDYILVMDDSNLEDVEEISPRNCKAVVKKLGSFDKNANTDDIIDPYYSNSNDSFEQIYEQCVKCCKGFLDWASSAKEK